LPGGFIFIGDHARIMNRMPFATWQSPHRDAKAKWTETWRFRPHIMAGSSDSLSSISRNMTLIDDNT